MKWLRGRQKGFTLIELLVAIPIIGLVGVAASGVIIQLLHASEVNYGVVAARQVQTAGDWVSLDGLQTQKVISGVANDNSTSGFPFTLSWSYWDTAASPPVNETHEVTYSLVNMPTGTLMQLQRHEVVKDKNGVVSSDTTAIVGRYIDASATSCRWVWSGSTRQPAFAFGVKAVVGDKTESRAYQIRPRSMT